MNTPADNTLREDPEARITALLLGELDAAEAAATEAAIAADPALQELRSRLAGTIGLLRQTLARPAAAHAPAEVPRLSAQRRMELMSQLKTVPMPVKRPMLDYRFGLLRVAALVLLLGIPAWIVLPMFLPIYKMSSIENPRRSDAYALESGRFDYKQLLSADRLSSPTPSGTPAAGYGGGGAGAGGFGGGGGGEATILTSASRGAAVASAQTDFYAEQVGKGVRARSNVRIELPAAAAPEQPVGEVRDLSVLSGFSTNRSLGLERGLSRGSAVTEVGEKVQMGEEPAVVAATLDSPSLAFSVPTSGNALMPTPAAPARASQLVNKSEDATAPVEVLARASTMEVFRSAADRQHRANLSIDRSANAPTAGESQMRERYAVPSRESAPETWHFQAPEPQADRKMIESLDAAVPVPLQSRGRVDGLAAADKNGRAVQLPSLGGQAAAGRYLFDVGRGEWKEAKAEQPAGGPVPMSGGVAQLGFQFGSQAGVKGAPVGGTAATSWVDYDADSNGDVEVAAKPVLRLKDSAASAAAAEGEVRERVLSLADAPKHYGLLSAEKERLAEPEVKLKEVAVAGAAAEAAGREIKPLQEAREELALIQQVDDGSKAVELAKSLPAEVDAVAVRPAIPPPEPQPDTLTAENAFSTFSLNVSDVSFKLAGAGLESGQMPDPGSIRSEEFLNAFDYRDPLPAAGQPVAFAWERARYPFAHNRDVVRFSVKTGAAGRPADRPLNLVLCLDNSGSMERADRVEIIREALRVLATQVRAGDRVSVVTFARTARVWVDGLPGERAGELVDSVGTLTPQGGTNLGDALRAAYETATKHYQADGINRVVLLTDGAANLGEVEPESLKKVVEAQRRAGVAFDCFGIGWEGYNDDLLETLSRNGDGRYGFVNTPEEAATEFVGQLAGALQVAASDVKVQVEFNPQRVTSFRQVGYAKHQLTKEQFRDNTVDAAEIGAAEAGNGAYVIQVNEGGQGPIATVRVRFKVPATDRYEEREWAVPYTGPAPAIYQAPRTLRLATSAFAFAEWLGNSPFAQEVNPDALLQILWNVPGYFGADPRPTRLEWMIRQAKSVSGK